MNLWYKFQKLSPESKTYCDYYSTLFFVGVTCTHNINLFYYDLICNDRYATHF